jgi:hypothetical protein
MIAQLASSSDLQGRARHWVRAMSTYLLDTRTELATSVRCGRGRAPSSAGRRTHPGVRYTCD